jgi:hypothetical protein
MVSTNTIHILSKHDSIWKIFLAHPAQAYFWPALEARLSTVAWRELNRTGLVIPWEIGPEISAKSQKKSNNWLSCWTYPIEMCIIVLDWMATGVP